MNTVNIIGNLTRDVQTRTTGNGKTVSMFSVAINRNYTTQTGERKQLTDYINVVAWGELAEAAAQKLRKGSRVFVEGRISSRSYEGTDGKKRYITEVVANTLAEPLSIQHSTAGFNQFGPAADEDVPF